MFVRHPDPSQDRFCDVVLLSGCCQEPFFVRKQVQDSPNGHSCATLLSAIQDKPLLIIDVLHKNNHYFN